LHVPISKLPTGISKYSSSQKNKESNSQGAAETFFESTYEDGMEMPDLQPSVEDEDEEDNWTPHSIPPQPAEPG
jgi:hypothetical protein